MIKGILRKMTIRYFLFAILPMLVINGIFFIFMRSNEEREQKSEMRAVTERIIYELKRNVDDAVSVSDYLYMNSDLNQFLIQDYTDGVDYYENFNQLLKDNVIRYYYTAQSVYRITIVTDNRTITDGTYFIQEEEVKNQEWYRKFQEGSQRIRVCTSYNDNPYLRHYQRARNISIVRKMDISQGTAVLKLDVDYTRMLQNIFHEEQNADIYICEGENIIFSNRSDDVTEDFTARSAYQKKTLEVSGGVELYGTDWEIFVTADRQGIFGGMRRNLFVSVLLVLFDISFPLIVIAQVGRIRQERQDLELSKKQAELNALQSQMNPHFMFNTLESIRMHSLIEGEEETERMLGKFSLLLRQASQWDRDFICIREEMSFIKSYLDIQKYRFGERLDYEISLEEGCEEWMVPKFGILTFVENACVHGVEKARNGKISAAVRREGRRLRIEIADNGAGIEPEQLEHIRRLMEQASMADLKGTAHVGMLNSMVRLRLYCEGNVAFEIQSAKDEGTTVIILLKPYSDSRAKKKWNRTGGDME